MSIDRSLKVKGALDRHRNVLSRDERIEKLKEEERWNEDEDSVMGLAKVVHRKSHAGKAAKAEKAAEKAALAEAEAAAAAEGATEEGAEAPAEEKKEEKK